jgi:chemotaxis protein methyltransferase CheR
LADGGPPAASVAAERAITPAQCRFFVGLARATARLNLDPAKTDFLQLRLSRRLRALGLSDFDAYEALLRDEPDGAEALCLVEALTTHTTSFFRESAQFDWLAGRGLDALTQAGAGFERPLILWSAACSTGAELWSAGMVLADAAARPGGLRRFKLFGTDVSRPILRKAASATYDEDEIAGVSADRRVRHLLRSRAPARDGRRFYRIAPELRERASFAVANLADEASLPPLAADVVFLRNVLIYFDAPTQAAIVQSVSRRIRQGGCLLTGHAEALTAQPGLRAIGPSIYRKE